MESLPFSCVIGYSPNWVNENAAATGSSEGQVTSWCDTCVSSELECKRMCLVDGAAAYNYRGKSCRCYSKDALTFTPIGTDWKFCANTDSTSSRTPPPSSGVDVFVRIKPSPTCTPCSEKETSEPSPSGRRQCTCEAGLTRTESSISKNWIQSCGPSQNITCDARSGQDAMGRRWWLVDLEANRSIVQLQIQACKHQSCWSRILGLKIALSNVSHFDANAFPCYTIDRHSHEAAREVTASCIGIARFVVVWVGSMDPTITHPVPPVDDASDLQDTYRDQLHIYLESQAELKAPSNNVLTLPWRLVRYLPTGSTLWHPVDDNLAGTQKYGTFQDPTSAWSVNFGTFNEFLFATRKSAAVVDSPPYTADIDLWLHCHKSAVNNGYYTDAARSVIASSRKTEAHTVRWYNRENDPSDPWISLRDHNYGTPARLAEVLYGEGSYKYSNIWNPRSGSMVFVRSALPGNIQVSHMFLDDVQLGCCSCLGMFIVARIDSFTLKLLALVKNDIL